MNVTRVFALLLAALSGPAFADAAKPMPEGWQMSGATAAFDAGTGAVAGMEGREAVWIRPNDNASYSKYALLTHTISAEAYRGKRVLIWARLKGERVERLALWGGVDDAAARRPILTDHATLFGTTDWQRHGAVLRVPENARTISYGVLIKGATGTGWVESIWAEEFDAARYELAGGKPSAIRYARRQNAADDWRLPPAGPGEGGSAFTNPFPGTWSTGRGWVAGYPGAQ